MTFGDFVSDAIGVPFYEFGRSYNGWDCWGLVIRAYRDVLEVDLPDFDYNDITDHRALLRHFDTRSDKFWVECDPHDMAVACIYRKGRVIHAGLCYDDRILHVERGIETCLEKPSRMRIEGYYEPANGGSASI